MAAKTISIRIGTASANSAHSSDLGKTTVINGITYRIVKASTALAAAAKKVVVDTLTSGVPQNVVAYTTSADNYLVAGVIPDVQYGSTGTTTIQAGDYFPLIVFGKGIPVLTDATTMLAGDPVGTCSVSGQVDTSTSGFEDCRLGITTKDSTASATTIYVTIDRIL